MVRECGAERNDGALSVARYLLPASRFPLPASLAPRPSFTFSATYSSFGLMTANWFSVTYYYGFIGYSRWGPRSRVR